MRMIFCRRFDSRRGVERQREERLTGTVRPTSVRVSDVLGIGGSVGTPRPTLDTGDFRRGGVVSVTETLIGVGKPGCVSDLFWVGMSVPAHPQAIEQLVGYRGWLKPPPPERAYGRDDTFGLWKERPGGDTSPYRIRVHSSVADSVNFPT